MTRPSDTSDATPRQLLAFAAIFAAAAAALVWAAYTRHPSLRVPPAVGYLVAAVCLAGSGAAAAKARGRPRLVETLTIAILLGFAAIGGWIALGDSGGACTTSAPLTGGARAAGCRVAFGVGAVLSAAMALVALATWRRGGAGSGSDGH